MDQQKIVDEIHRILCMAGSVTEDIYGIKIYVLIIIILFV